MLTKSLHKGSLSLFEIFFLKKSNGNQYIKYSRIKTGLNKGPALSFSLSTAEDLSHRPENPDTNITSQTMGIQAVTIL